MKLKRHTVLPLVLAVYLAVMAYIGYPEYAAGHSSALYYFGIIGITVVILIALHFTLKKRDRLRRERMEDIERNNNNSKQ